MTLWQFEAWWRDHAKRSHALFRRAYNHLGPVVARRISSAWKADLAYLMLKPVEFVAQLFLKWTGDSPPTSGGFGVPPD